MPPKPEPTPAPAAAAPAPVAVPAASSGSKITGLIPVILVVVLAPVVSWAVAQFVIIPKMEQRLTAAVSKAGAAPATADAGTEETASAEDSSAHGGAHGAAPKKGEASGATNSYEFSNVVVNLAGTMGTRYLKATFLVTGKDPHIRDTFNKDKAKLVDVTLNVLSSLSLADLEEAGAKNIIREKLVNAYNQALGKKVVDQIYFSDFVVQ